MVKLTRPTTNKFLNRVGFEIVQGNGYIYFWGIGHGESYYNLRYESIAVNKLSDLTLSELIQELEYKIKESYVSGSEILYSDNWYKKLMMEVKKIKTELNITESIPFETHYIELPKID